MVSGNLERIREIFGEARRLPAAERRAFLDRACGGDAGLLAEVESLLASDVPATMGLMTPEAIPELPRQIGPYVIVGMREAGGMGIVYEARQQNPSRTVALKVIRSELASPSAHRRFEVEANALAKLQHPNIAAIYEGGSAPTAVGERPYFAMEFIPGQPLTKYAAEHKLSQRTRLELLARIADAVHYAHTKGIIHRDLKPDNILVVPPALPGDVPVPKILDFGLARATDADLHSTSMQTEEGAVLGTLAYMAPEQTTGKPDDIDTQSDIYALGVIAFELLTGRLPYDVARKPIPAAIQIIQNDEPTRLSSIDRKLRGDVETIVLKAMEKEKSRRYPSAADLAADIRRHLANEPISARPASASYQLAKFARRNKVLVGGVIATFLTLIAGIAVSTTFAVRLKRNAAALAVANDQSRQRLAATYVRTAQLASQRGAWEEAAEDYRLAIEAGAADPLSLRLMRARALLYACREAEGTRELAEVERQDTDHRLAAQIDYYRATMVPGQLLGDQDRETLLRRALAGSGLTVAETEMGLGALSSDMPGAIAHYQAAAKADPFSPETHIFLGGSLLVMGELPDGLSHLELAAQLRPQDRTMRMISALLVVLTKPPQNKGDLGRVLDGLEEGERGFVEAFARLMEKSRTGSVGLIDTGAFLLKAMQFLRQHQASLSQPIVPNSWRPLITFAMANLVADSPGRIENCTRLIATVPSPFLYLIRGCAHGAERHDDLAIADIDRFLASPAASVAPQFRHMAAEARLLVHTSQLAPTIWVAQIEPGAARLLLKEGRQYMAENGPPDPLTCCRLAMTAMSVGQYDVAQAYVSLVPARLCEDAGGDFEAPSLLARALIAVAHGKAGRPDRAIPLLVDVLPGVKATFGPDHLSTLTCMNDLARAYRDSGQLSRALPLYEETLRRLKSIQAPEHPLALMCMNDFAAACESAGDWNRGIALREEVLRQQRVKQGSDHEDSLAVMNSLAVAYWHVGRLDRSIPLFEERLAIVRRKYGNDHVEVGRTLANLGVNYRDGLRYEQAIGALQEAVDQTRRLKLQDMDWAVEALGDTFALAGRFGEGETFCRRAIEEARARPGDDGCMASRLQAALAYDLLHEGKLEEAEKVCRQSLAHAEAAHANEWKTFHLKWVQGAVMLGQGKHAEAEPLLLGGYDGLKRREDQIPAGYRPRLMEAIEGIVRLYEEWGKSQQAAAWRARLVAARESQLRATSRPTSRP